MDKDKVVKQEDEDKATSPETNQDDNGNDEIPSIH